MASQVQTRSIAARPTFWGESFIFDQQDPANGAVNASLSVTGTLTATAYVENQDTAAANFTETDTGLVAAGSVIVYPSVSLSATLGAFDGTVDSAGTSGQVLTGSGSATGGASYVNGGTGPGLPIYGTGTFAIPAYASASITATGPGNMAALFLSSAADTATLTTSPAAGSATGSGVLASSFRPVVTIGFPLLPVGTVTSSPQTITLAPRTTGWTAGTAIAGFDPHRGTLVGVSFAFTLSGGGSNDLRNFDPVSRGVTVDQAATVTLGTPSGTVLASDTDYSHAATFLPGYADNAAWSLATHGTSSPPLTTTITDPASLSAFATPGIANLNATGTGTTTVNGPGNLGVVTTLTVGAQVDVRYLYVAARDPLFDAPYYLAHNPDVAAAGVDPLQHFLSIGWTEGRNPDALFDTTYYLAHNPDVAAAHVDPLLHYEAYGWHEGRDPSAAFSTNRYLAAYPDVKAAGVDPLQHYVSYGQAEGRTAFTS